MRILITGIAGQDAHYLYKNLREHKPKAEIYGLYRGQDERRLAQLQENMPELLIVRGDLTDALSVTAAINETYPDWIFNLAAVSSVPLSLQFPYLTHRVNTEGVVNILNAVQMLGTGSRVFQASTSEMFGNSADTGKLLNEQSRMLPTSPYGISKLAAHLACRNYRVGHGMHVATAISFNHESTLRAPIFVTRKVTQAAARIKLGKQERLKMGNINSRRDWGFAGDYVDAFRLILEQEKPDDFVLGTGRAPSIRELLSTAFGHVGLNWEDYVDIDSAFLRPEDNNHFQADVSKARDVLGWEATTTFEELIKDMILNDLEIESSCH